MSDLVRKSLVYLTTLTAFGWACMKYLEPVATKNVASNVRVDQHASDKNRQLIIEKLRNAAGQEPPKDQK